MTSFLHELKRRNVYKVAVAYAAVAWLLIQVATQTFPFFEVPNWAIRLVIVLLALGFPVALVFAWAFELTPSGVQRTPDDRTQPAGGVRSHAWIYVALVAGALSIGLFFLGRHTARSPGARTEMDKSIAVLPLSNAANDPAQEYFSDGLTEELINVLGQIRQLRVIGPNSSFRFKGNTADSRAIGQTLGVAHLLEGSVRKAGERVRIGLHLVKAADGIQLWSQTYDRELKDIFAVQAEIARAVADQLRVALLAVDVPIGAQPSNKNLEAYHAYLRAAAYIPRMTDPEGPRRAIEFVEEALRLDPDYAEAHALKALVLNQTAYFLGVNGRETFKQAAAAAKAALARSPDNARARASLAYAYMNSEWDVAAADAELAQAGRDSPMVLNTIGVLRAYQGRGAEAIQLYHEAIALEPAFPLYRVNLATALLRAGRYDEAEASLRKALEIRADAGVAHFLLAAISALRGDPEASLREAEQELIGLFRDAALAIAYAATGDQVKAEEAVERLVKTYGAVAPYRIAQVYAFRREPDRMFEWLERAYAVHDPRVIALRSDPFLQPYERDERFLDLCRRLRLPLPG